MYIEGTCVAENLVPSIVQHLKDATDNMGNKLWEMVSSNVGERIAASPNDGWVFKSKGSSGKDNLILGFSNGPKYSQSYNWVLGNAMFVASDYKPGVPGSNGKFTNQLSQAMPIFAQDWNGYSEKNLPMRYFLSVTADRVICAYFSDVLHTHSRSNLFYLGKPAWTASPDDEGILMGSAIDDTWRQTAKVVMTEPYMVRDTDTEFYTVDAVLGAQARGWGGKLYPSRLVLSSPSSTRGGQRGILDLLVIRPDSQFRKVDTVRIDDIEFLCVELPNSTIINSNYGSSTFPNALQPSGYSIPLVYLFPKI